MLRRVCPYMLRAVQYVVLKANTLPGIQKWLGIRISYGMNGIVLPAEDIPSFVAVLRANVTRKPPDLIWQMWAAGKHRPPVRAPWRASRHHVPLRRLVDGPAAPAPWMPFTVKLGHGIRVRAKLRHLCS